MKKIDTSAISAQAHNAKHEQSVAKHKRSVAQHTAGEWQAKPATLSPKDPMFYKADVICGGIKIASVAGVGEDNSNANARLIAAAPDLLSALEELLSLCPDLHFAKRNQYERVIAKAKGE